VHLSPWAGMSPLLIDNAITGIGIHEITAQAKLNWTVHHLGTLIPDGCAAIMVAQSGM
jgi:hypothetical protein